MKKLSLFITTLFLTVILTACSYKGDFDYMEVDLEEYGIKTSFAIAFPKNTTLDEPFNAVITKLIEDKTMECLISYWEGELNDPCRNEINFTTKKYNLDYNLEGKTLKGLTSPDYPPYEYIDTKTNKTIGLDIDLIKIIAKELNFNLNLVDAGFDTIIPSITTGSADFAISGINPTDERRNSVKFTIDYHPGSNTVAVFRKSDNFKSIDDLKNKTVAAQSGSVQAELIAVLVEEHRVRKEVTVSGAPAGIQSLKTNKIDVLFVEKTVADSLLKTYNKGE